MRGQASPDCPSAEAGDARTVLVIHEADVVDTRQLAELLDDAATAQPGSTDGVGGFRPARKEE
jgi:hypothetical protein